jgi:hypothetical protein
LEGSVNLVGEAGRTFSAEEGARVLTQRASRADLAADGRHKFEAGIDPSAVVLKMSARLK